ncbi:4-diphosphocytidyl-2-C-methyl-D-erythritol kinase [Algoriphagus ratkowskyi]|uniref:4-diphosphocytidyl-2-C-methyl-D-erythritol kinase n=1 Tax=Algoriphagus ratkowskyi TaxID=57028 RepID=A0A2W7RYC7_9BACT|nr:4-(cytidine 5'-diphospho)-2-C-methyl-D-erythritol kinase [Algoriphagus ratkowskyi]PZX59589.1 4-diphosphocytidyl-2-C-methyl-D-erythritol kinase [Algoriphagus ratkowskyi]TXD78687.1 4-(cytidine 5'-diphospho)-2-C-methyl-D-erythritol kinase [Algoriphagus ratkowskyi]
MISFPNAKINLGLHITAKRKNGFHTIESCMVPIPLLDGLEMIVSTKKTSFESTGLEIPGNAKDNLIFKAYQLLKKDFPSLPEVSIHLHKNIPMGAGLGGGSADAAFALNLMNNLFDLILDDFFLEEYAAELGSDCPFFIENTPKIARGRGEILEPVILDLTGTYLVLINPGIHIGTKEAYAGVTPAAPKVKLEDVLADRNRWKNELVNDFEASIFPNHPEIAAIKERLYDHGAYYAAMSGSGSSVFGLFEDKPTSIEWNKGCFMFETVL